MVLTSGHWRPIVGGSLAGVSTMLRTSATRLASLRTLTMVQAAWARPLSYKVGLESAEWTGKQNNAQRSASIESIAKVPVIEVDKAVAVCDGGGGALGHPLTYIQLNDDVPDQPKTCLYCGLQYIMKPAQH